MHKYQAGRLHVKPAAGLLAADIAKVPLKPRAGPPLAGMSAVKTAVSTVS
jgi:hypothetical protein